MLKAKQLRAQARKTLNGNIFSGAWLKGVLVVLITSAIIGFLGMLTSGSMVLPTYQQLMDAIKNGTEIEMTEFALPIGNQILSLLSTVISIFIIPVFTFGLVAAFSDAVKEKESPKIGNIFKGFSLKRYLGVVTTELLVAVFTALWTLLLIVPGIIKMFSYAMTPYILNDDPSCKNTAAITKSRKMMKGHKWQLFCLELSFIGWYIVGALCLGVGALWVDAYRNAAMAQFYQELKKEEK